MKYQIEIKKSALKALKRLDAQTVGKIKKAIDKLAHDPRPFGYKKLVMKKGFFAFASATIE